MADPQGFVIHRLDSEDRYPLEGALRVGRRDDCEILLTAHDASRQHARLTVEDGSAWVEDLNSTNGTFVNEERIVGKRRLKVGDSLRFVTERFELKATAAPKPDAWKQAVKKDSTVGIEDWRRRQAADSAAADAARNEVVEEPTLMVVAGDDRGLRIALTATAGEMKWTIGADPERVIRFQDAGVSGLHATLSSDGRRWKIVDELAKNGVLVNNEPVITRFLEHGDRISLGPVHCLFMLPGGGNATRPGAQRPTPTAKRSGGAGKVVGLVVGLVVLAAVAYFAARALHLLGG